MNNHSIEYTKQSDTATADLADKQHVSQESLKYGDKEALKIVRASSKEDTAGWLNDLTVSNGETKGNQQPAPETARSEQQAPSVPEQRYTVEKNETLSAIALRALPRGASINDIYNFVNAIAKYNNIADPDFIKAGQDLYIPARTGRSIGTTVLTEQAQGETDGKNTAVNKNPLGGVVPSDSADLDHKKKTTINKNPLDMVVPANSANLDASNRNDAQDARDNDAKVEAAMADTGANRIQTALTEVYNIVEGRSQSTLEKDIRDTVRSLNANQIAELNLSYQQKTGSSLSDALLNDAKLSTATKDSLEIYLKGNDNRTDQDRSKLIDIALQDKNLDMYAETMKDSSPELRKAFISDGGADKLAQAFGKDSTDYSHALDLANEGKLGTATQIKDNTGFISDSTEGIELALKRMTDQERSDYGLGKHLADSTYKLNATDAGRLDHMSDSDQQQAKETYEKIHESLQAAGNDTEITKWEDMIAQRDGSLISSLAGHRGHLYNDSISDISKDVENMSRQDWEAAKANPASRDELKKMLISLNKNEEEINQVIGVYDKKVAASSWDQAQDAGRRSIIQELEDNTHWNGNDRGAMLEAISKMSADEQRRYREDSDFRNQVKAKVSDAIGSGPAFESAEKMLGQIEEGEKPSQQMSVENLTALNKGFFNDDESKTYEYLANATADEKTRLINDAQYRQQVIGFLNEDEQKVAMAVVEQGAVKPEDKVRDAIVGYGGSQEIIAALRSMKPEEISERKSEYARKYGHDLESDLDDKLSGNEKAEAKRLLARNLSAEEQHNLLRGEYSAARSGMGAWLSDNVWRSGTGAQADDAMNDYTQVISDAHQGQHQADQKQVALTQAAAEKSVDNHKDSKATAAEYVKDGVITVGTITAVALTDGVAIPLLVGTAGGAVADVGTKKVLMGQDYEMTAGQVTKDAATGAFIGASSAVGPGEIKAFFSPAEAAVETTAKVVAVESGEEGVEHAVTETTKAVADKTGQVVDQSTDVLEKSQNTGSGQGDQLDVPPIWKKEGVVNGSDGVLTSNAAKDVVEHPDVIKATPHGDAAQWVGARDNQEDTFWFSQDQKVFVVSDGMGGEGGGEIASDITTAQASKMYAKFPHGGNEAATKKWLADYVEAADQKIREVRTASHLGKSYAATDGASYLPVTESSWDRMGSTVVASARQGNNLYVASVGDSRAYLLRDGVLKQLTVDQQNLDGTLTSALGHQHFPDIVKVELKQGDRILIASDGLETLSHQAIQTTLKQAKTAQEASAQLVKAVRQAGAEGQDNVTALVFDPQVSFWRGLLN